MIFCVISRNNGKALFYALEFLLILQIWSVCALLLKRGSGQSLAMQKLSALCSRLAQIPGIHLLVLSDACVRVFYYSPVFTYATPAKRRAYVYIYMCTIILFHPDSLNTVYKYGGQVYTRSDAVQTNRKNVGKATGQFCGTLHCLHNGCS